MKVGFEWNSPMKDQYKRIKTSFLNTVNFFWTVKIVPKPCECSEEWFPVIFHIASLYIKRCPIPVSAALRCMSENLSLGLCCVALKGFKPIDNVSDPSSPHRRSAW